MKPWYRWINPAVWPIAVKLSAMLLLAALVPMNVTAYYNLRGSLASVKKTAYQNLELLAASTANRLDQLIIDTQRVVIGISGDRHLIAFLSVPVNQRDKETVLSVQQMLQNILKSNPDYASIIIFDRKGIGQASTNPKNVGQDIAFREYFQEAIRGNNYISEVSVGKTTYQPGIYFSAPIRDYDNEIIGVAVIKFQGESIRQVVESLRVDSQGSAFLIDENGIIISERNQSLLYHSLGKIPPEQMAIIDPVKRFGLPEIKSLELTELANQMVRTTKLGHTSYLEKTKERQMVGFAPMKFRPWVVGVKEPEAEFAAPLERLAMQTNLSVFAVGSAVTILAILLANGIVKPLKKLTAAAEAISHGDFDTVRVQVTSEDEIGLLAQSFNLMAEGLRDRQRERDIFGRAVSPEVREQLLKGKLALGGETRTCAVLFSDIRGFSSISEQMTPQEVVTFLNEYLTAMTNAIRPWGGYINNFIGDAILVIFGAPVDYPDKEWRAVAAALTMRQCLKELNQQRAARGEVIIESGIGISTGEVVAGQVGSLERLMYTTIGDAVNVAARLETMTKDYLGHPILIEANTARALQDRDDILMKSLGSMQVKGRIEPVDVYTIIDWKNPAQIKTAIEPDDGETL